MLALLSCHADILYSYVYVYGGYNFLPIRTIYLLLTPSTD